MYILWMSMDENSGEKFALNMVIHEIYYIRNGIIEQHTFSRNKLSTAEWNNKYM